MSYRSRQFLLSLLRRKADRLPQLGAKAYRSLRKHGFHDVKSKIRELFHRERAEADYRRWIEIYDTLTDSDRKAILGRIEQLAHKPLISIILPVYEVEEVWLRRALESVRDQIYPLWELCIADDNSRSPHVRRVLEEYARSDTRVKLVLRERNGHISAASNTALQVATGEFIALLDHDDELAEHALYLIAEEIDAYPEVVLIYSDEDKLTPEGERSSPFFKPHWSLDRLYSLNAVSHLGVYRTSIVREIGGFREGYEGSQDYDLALRVIEQIPEDHIRHIPHALYHWRQLEGSVAFDVRAKEFAHEAAQNAIRSHLNRLGVEATVTDGYLYSHRVIYPLSHPPKVSLVIAVTDLEFSPERLIGSLLDQTNYTPVQLLVVHHGNESIKVLQSEQTVTDRRVELLSYNGPTNLAALLNFAVNHATGDVIGCLGPVRVVSPEWLTEMVSHAMRPSIGAVGAKIYGPDGSIQHAGVVLGINGTAGYAYRNLPQNRGEETIGTQVIQNYSAISGDCLVCRKEVFNEIGGFDAVHFPTSYYDIDFCLRLRRRGYQILWTPYAELCYLESAPCLIDSDRVDSDQLMRERSYLKSKWSDLIKDDPYYNPNLTLEREDFSVAVPPRATVPWK